MCPQSCKEITFSNILAYRRPAERVCMSQAVRDVLVHWPQSALLLGGGGVLIDSYFWRPSPAEGWRTGLIAISQKHPPLLNLPLGISRAMSFKLRIFRKIGKSGKKTQILQRNIRSICNFKWKARFRFFLPEKTKEKTKSCFSFEIQISPSNIYFTQFPWVYMDLGARD